MGERGWKHDPFTLLLKIGDFTLTQKSTTCYGMDTSASRCGPEARGVQCTVPCQHASPATWANRPPAWRVQSSSCPSSAAWSSQKISTCPPPQPAQSERRSAARRTWRLGGCAEAGRPCGTTDFLGETLAHRRGHWEGPRQTHSPPKGPPWLSSPWSPTC